MKKLTSGQLCKIIKEIDPDSIVERKNVRYFCRKENLDYTICQGKWLMDLECFINKLNPKHYTESKPFPRLRTKISAQNEWNAHHRKKIKHHIIDCICDSGKVFVYKHGNRNIINYDQLEAELIRILKERGQY
jgi:hypothetical protein